MAHFDQSLGFRGGAGHEQEEFDLRPNELVGDVLNRIFAEASSESEKGRWFEHLFMAVVADNPDFDVAEIWPWRAWPDREAKTSLDGRDHGIDLVARLNNGITVAIQCKCYSEAHLVSKRDIDSFLAESSRDAFGLRWIVSTSGWNSAAERAIKRLNPRVRRIDFLDFRDRKIRELQKPDRERHPKPLQQSAIDAVYDGLVTQGNDRGRLVMACGTGKTFTSLRLAERVVPDNGQILFAAPTIALVSQARKEWLTHTTRKMSAMVVCSDETAGGRGDEYETGVSELTCEVTSKPSEIATRLQASAQHVTVVFCTYHSLRRVCEAQQDYQAPRFDLAIADEAHRTTGVAREDTTGSNRVDFQTFHAPERLRASKRLYMTATQRIYSERSVAAAKRSAEKYGLKYEVVDMSDVDVYGPLLHHVKFSEAVAEDELSDYRVIVLGIRDNQLSPGIRSALQGKNVPARVSQMDLCRLLGTMLALNGVVEGQELPGRLSRSIAFASTIERSKWFTETINDNHALKMRVTKVMSGRGKRAGLEARHLDGTNTALKRNQERRWLNDAPKRDQARMICNVKVFSEGVDVPALEAVSFLDPKQSHIDIVQAVGRVMRKAPGKKRGYVVVPVYVPEGEGDIANLLEQRADDYRHIGSVLRALQSHDERLAESPATFIDVLMPNGGNGGGEDPPPGGGGEDNGDPEGIQGSFTFHAVEPGIFAKVVASSGLGRPGQITADEIARAVRMAASRIEDNVSLLDSLRAALDLTGVKDKEVSTTAALLLCNACLLHRRLQAESPKFEELPNLTAIGRSEEPADMLAVAWDKVLERDYKPVFRPALSIIEHSPSFESLKPATQILASEIGRISDTVADLGYDHAGPLYHKILGRAESDGAYYTDNISALMLAGLALSPDIVEWSNWDQATRLRILDPACGTGSLLMAALKTIKDRMTASSEEPIPADRVARLHKELVENSIYGFDINYQATQLAASNLTLGAPSVDYDAMNILTLQHGPQANGTVALGSVDLLPKAMGSSEQLDLLSHVKEAEVSTPDSPESKVPSIGTVDVILMNPPFTNNVKRAAKYSAEDKKRMQVRELQIKSQIMTGDREASEMIDVNSVRTFFTPLANALLRKDSGVLGMVLPTTACTSTSGVAERKYIAKHFHVDTIVTSHDPKHPNFSVNTAIHESLLVCRRRTEEASEKPTIFISIHKMPRTPSEVADWLPEAHSYGGAYHRVFAWPHARVAEGDWTPCQYYDGSLAEISRELDDLERLVPLGQVALVEPGGQRLRDAFENPLKRLRHSTPSYDVVWTHKTGERTRMRSFSDYATSPKESKHEYATNLLLPKASKMLLACKINPQAIRVTAIHLERPVLGQPFIPVTPLDGVSDPPRALQAWCAYLNSTPAALSWLNRRQKKLTYAAYSLDQLRSIPVPDPKKVDLDQLVDVFFKLGDAEMLPWPEMHKCAVRAELDDAVAKVLGIDEAELRQWRERIAKEPIVSGKAADDMT